MQEQNWHYSNRKFNPNGEKYSISLHLVTPSLQALAKDLDLTTWLKLHYNLLSILFVQKKEKPIFSIINAFNYQRHPITFTLHLDTFVHELRLNCTSLQWIDTHTCVLKKINHVKLNIFNNWWQGVSSLRRIHLKLECDFSSMYRKWLEIHVQPFNN